MIFERVNVTKISEGMYVHSYYSSDFINKPKTKRIRATLRRKKTRVEWAFKAIFENEFEHYFAYSQRKASKGFQSN